MRRLALSELALARLYCMDLGSGSPVDIAKADTGAGFTIALNVRAFTPTIATLPVDLINL